MDIQASKIELTKIILNSENDSFIERLKEFISNEDADFWNELHPSERSEIQAGIEQLNLGKRTKFHEILENLS